MTHFKTIVVWGKNKKTVSKEKQNSNKLGLNAAEFQYCYVAEFGINSCLSV